MRKLFCFSAAFAAAVFALRYGAAPLVLLALPAALWRREDRALRAGLVCLGLIAGLLWCRGYDALVRAPARALENTWAEVSATVEDWPRETSHGVSVTVRVRTPSGPDAKALLYADENYAWLSPGDGLTFTARFRPADRVRGAADETCPARGVFLRAYANGEALTVERPDRVPLRYWPAQWAGGLRRTVESLFPSEVSPLIRALLTGDKTRLSDADYGALQRAGLAHTVAVSGLHISFLVWVAVQLLGRNRRRTALLALPLLAFYALAVGGSPSVVRAVVMQGLLLLAPLLGRETDPPTSLAFALLLLLVQNPYAAHSVSLQLSFAAVVGLLAFSGRLESFLRDKLDLKPARKGWKRWRNKAVRLLVTTFSGTCGALAFSTPLAAWQFGSVSLIAPLSNLLCLWCVELVFTLGLTAAALGMAVPAMGGALAALVTPFARWLLWMARHLADLPFASLSLTSPYLTAWLAFVYGVFLLCCVWRRQRRYVLPVCACVCTLCVCLVLTRLADTAPRLTLVALDVGQGQSTLLRCGARTALVDCGGSEGNAGDLAADYLRDRGRDSLDLLVLTHFHADHANGVAELLERVRVDVLAVPDVEPDDPLRRELLALAEEKGTQVWLVREDARLAFGSAELTLYAPLGAGEANEEGLSLLCRAGDFTALFTGDMGADIEARLVKYGDLPQVDVLAVGHHGSKNAASQLLLEAVSPETALVSVGYNTYGHPSPETLLRLDGADCVIYRTDLQGTITVTVG